MPPLPTKHVGFLVHFRIIVKVHSELQHRIRVNQFQYNARFQPRRFSILRPLEIDDSQRALESITVCGLLYGGADSISTTVLILSSSRAKAGKTARKA
jgi:hypothetical protein